MKVILLQELKGRGGEGDVIEVKHGYAVNYLLPNKMATEATKGNLKQLELRKHNIAKRETERLDSADKIHNALANKVLTIPARVGEEGQLFGSVTTQQIADKLNEEFGLEVDRRKIDLRSPIKTAGEHSVIVSVYRDIKATLTVNVVSEDADLSVAEETPAVDEAEETTDVADVADEEASDIDEKVDAIVEEDNQTMKEVADKLAAAADAEDESDDEDPHAIADAAAEVFQETESVVDTAAETAIQDVASDDQ